MSLHPIFSPSFPSSTLSSSSSLSSSFSLSSVPLPSHHPTPLQANIRAQQRASFKQITEKPQKKEEREEATTMYFDSRVTVPSSQRGKKVFKFNDPGK